MLNQRQDETFNLKRIFELLMEDEAVGFKKNDSIEKGLYTMTRI